MELETMSRTEMRQLKRSAGMGVTFSLPMSENILGRWLCRAATRRSLKLKLKVSVSIKIKLNNVSIFYESNKKFKLLILNLIVSSSETFLNLANRHKQQKHS